MKLPELRIRNLHSEYPIIQAGMGVRVANSRLAAATINLGGFGTIASVGLGDVEKSKFDFENESTRVLIEEIRKARALTSGKGPLGVNVMVALSNYDSIVKAAVDEGAEFILSGAGLPIYLPGIVGDKDVALIPIISSGRALKIIMSAWKRKYSRLPDAVVVEGPLCGGHLGFTTDQLAAPEDCSLDILYRDVKAVLAEFNCNVPVLAAGEIASVEDVKKNIALGYDGVQIGTFFIASEEAGMDEKSKNVYINSTSSDVVVIKSPVGLPVRVLNTPLVQRVMTGKREKFGCPYHCLRTCVPKEVPFCIAKALLATWSGDVENGLYMTGCNVDAMNEIFPLKKFFDSLNS